MLEEEDVEGVGENTTAETVARGGSGKCRSAGGVAAAGEDRDDVGRDIVDDAGDDGEREETRG